MVGLQLTQLSGNCSVHQHVVHHNSISCQKKTTFVGTHDWTFFKNKLLTVTWISAQVLSAQVLSAQVLSAQLLSAQVLSVQV